MSLRTFSRPANDRYFEDYELGAVYDCGSVVVDEAEVIAFAERYDPQFFHTDPAAAKNSMFGGLIASGWHTASMMMRLLVEHYLSSVASLASPGVDELRWLAPVRPGDTLRVQATVKDARVSKSNPTRGVVTGYIEVLNQDDVVVSSVKAVNLLLTRAGLAR